MIIWKYTPRDWKITEKMELTQKLLNNLHNGSIILLHDCGKTFGADENAPMVMIEALRETFEKVRNSPIKFNALEEKITKEVNMEKTIEKTR